MFRDRLNDFDHHLEVFQDSFFSQTINLVEKQQAELQTLMKEYKDSGILQEDMAQTIGTMRALHNKELHDLKLSQDFIMEFYKQINSEMALIASSMYDHFTRLMKRQRFD